MNAQIVSYLLYLATCVPMAIAVGYTLHKNGRVFLVDVFAGREDVADSVNHLLLVGFYLLTVGFVSIFTRVGAPPEDAAEMIQWVSTKVGAVLLVLGVVHMFNVRVLSSLGRRFLPGGDAPAQRRPAPQGPRTPPANQQFYGEQTIR